MAKRANPMAVKAALTYDISEAANALGKSPATVRNWIKDGLPVMSSRKPNLILGAAIRDYLRTKRNAAKRSLGAHELYCLSCREPRRPARAAVTIKQTTPATSLLKGVCERCGCTCARMIASRDVCTFGAIFQVTEDADSAP